MSILEKTIEYLNPEWALDRQKARYRLKRNYEAASRGPRLSGWVGTNTPNPTDMDLKTIRERARYLEQNNPYATTTVRALTNYIVGKGIKPHSDNKKAEKVLKGWADTLDCDADESLNLYGIQALALRHLIVDGEIFIQKVIDRKSKVPLKLRLLEADYLADNPKQNVIRGIEYDNQRKRVAYHFYERHPHAETDYRDLNKIKRIPADQIIHLFFKKRASQSRGVSLLAPIMVRLKTFDEYEDAELVRQRNAAAYVGFYRSLDGENFLGNDEDNEESKKQTEISPGSIFSAPSGETLEFNQPPQVSSYAPYTESTKHTLAIGAGIPYFLLSGDFSKANFSNARMSMLTFYRNVDQFIEHVMIPLLCKKIEKWLSEALFIKGFKLPKLEWVAPKKEFTDPIKEIEAYKMAVDEGFIAHSQVIREMGDDPDDTYQEIFKLNEHFDKNKAHWKEKNADSKH